MSRRRQQQQPEPSNDRFWYNVGSELRFLDRTLAENKFQMIKLALAISFVVLSYSVNDKASRQKNWDIFLIIVKLIWHSDIRLILTRKRNTCFT